MMLPSSGKWVRAVRARGGRRIANPFIATLLLAALPNGGCGQEPELRSPFPRHDSRPEAVENGLTAAIHIRGQEPERFTIQARMERYRVPGVSVAVIEGDSISWVRAYGVSDVETREAVTPATLFQAASISKPVAALAALRLVEEGILELDAPVNRYLTGWRIPENGLTARQPVTLRHLLTHTGGLTVHGFPGYAVTEALPTLLEILDGGPHSNTPPIRVDTLPESLWRYSGGGYTVLQKLLEDVTEKPFPVLMRELILDPVGMPMSAYSQPLPPGKEGQAASGHLPDGSRVEGRWHVYPEMAAAGLWTNPMELARLTLEVKSAWRGEPARILSPEMARAMLTPGMGNQGLGFAVRAGEGATRFGHGGSNHGFKAQVEALVEGGQGVVVMTNGDQGSSLAQEIIRAVQEMYAWPVPGPRTIEVAEVAPEVLDQVAGRYRIQGTRRVLSIRVEGDHLRGLLEEEREGNRFFPLSPTRFIGLEDGQEFEVVIDSLGNVGELAIRGGPRALRIEG